MLLDPKTKARGESCIESVVVSWGALQTEHDNGLT